MGIYNWKKSSTTLLTSWLKDQACPYGPKLNARRISTLRHTRGIDFRQSYQLKVL